MSLCFASPGRTCLEIGEIKHGIISASGGLFGDRVELQCQVGYSLDGPSTIQCQADGRWSSQFGQCKGKGMPQKIYFFTYIFGYNYI